MSQSILKHQYYRAQKGIKSSRKLSIFKTNLIDIIIIVFKKLGGILRAIEAINKTTNFAKEKKDKPIILTIRDFLLLIREIKYL